MGSFERHEHFKSEAQAQNDKAEMRRIAILFFIVGSMYIFAVWMKSRRKMGIEAQQRDLEQTHNLVYIDRAAMHDMNLTMQDVA